MRGLRLQAVNRVVDLRQQAGKLRLGLVDIHERTARLPMPASALTPPPAH